MLATRIRQKEGTFYFIAYNAVELLDKVRFTSRYFFEGEEIVQGKISENDSPMMALKPARAMPCGACSRDDPQPKLPFTMRTVAPR